MFRKCINISPLKFTLINLFFFLPAVLSLYLFYRAFNAKVGAGDTFLGGVDFGMLWLCFFYRYVLIGKDSAVIQNDGIMLYYFIKKMDRFVTWGEIEGYFEEKGKVHKVVIVTKTKKQFVIDYDFKKGKKLIEDLNDAGVKSISKRFLYIYYIMIPLILVFLIQFGIAPFEQKYSEAAHNKAELKLIKGQIKDESTAYFTKIDRIEGGLIVLKDYPNVEAHFSLYFITDKDAYESLNLKKDTTTYFFQISKKSYDLRFAKTVKPNFFQKYFNQRIEIYGMRTYGKKYFEVFK